MMDRWCRSQTLAGAFPCTSPGNGRKKEPVSFVLTQFWGHNPLALQHRENVLGEEVDAAVDELGDKGVWREKYKVCHKDLT